MRNKFITAVVVLILLATNLIVTPVHAAPLSAGAANDHTVLILSTSVSGGASSIEAVQAGILGFSVEMADATQWSAKTQADFGTYRALIIGDAVCSTSTGFLQAALDNRTTWSPAISGNIILVGGDPEYHAVYQAKPGAIATIKNGIGFAADVPGKTGFYAAFGCLYYAAPESGTAITFLDQFGTFSARGVSSDTIHIVANHPALAGLTDENLSNWGSSTHAAIVSYPSSFIPLAIQKGTTGNGSLTFPDETFGTPYMIARGEDLFIEGGPTISGISPNQGPTTGGTVVTITGTNLTGGTFTFGGATTSCVINSDGTEAICTSPAHAVGPVDVAVVVGTGIPATVVDGFTYITVLNPSVTVNQAVGQLDPTNTSPVNFSVIFSETVTGFDSSDVLFTGSTAPGVLSASISGSGPTYLVSVTGMTGDGTIVMVVPADAAANAALLGNSASTSEDNSVTYDGSIPTITVEQSVGQVDPTNTSPIIFTVTFSETVTGFDSSDISFTGSTAPGVLSGAISGTGPDYSISVSGMTGTGTVVVSIPDGVASDEAGNANSASTSEDNSVTYDITGPIVVLTSLKSSYLDIYPIQFDVNFNKIVFDPTGDSDAKDVTNPDNYLLIDREDNTIFDTTSCDTGVLGDDIKIPILKVTYDNSFYVARVDLVDKLVVGNYRLFVCGTTSVIDLAGNPINNGSDFTFDFSVRKSPNLPSALPEAGFAIGHITELPKQSSASTYANSKLMFSIPTLGVEMPIVSVPQVDNKFDVSWLGKSAGYLEGSAFPTLVGNTVLVGHVWNADNTPGVFASIKDLKYGDRFFIYAFGMKYIYEVRENKIVAANNISTVFKHETLDWVTLLTCESFNNKTESYVYRRIVRAVLISVK